MDPTGLGLFLIAATLLAATPGPGLLYVAARSLAGGHGEGIASSFGTGAGGLVHVAGAAAGVSVVILASAELFTALKLAGAAYLVWLGLRTIRAARRDAGGSLAALPTIGARRAFREGIVVEALNPKTAAFFLTFLPQFVNPGVGSVALQMILLGSISVALNTAADVVVALSAGRLRSALATRATLLARLRAASGAMMIALGLGVLLARRPTG